MAGKMKKILLSVFFLFATSLSDASSLHLKELMREAEEGDYVISYQNKAFTLLHAFSRQGSHLELEEITLPSHLHDKSYSWKEWLLAGAPGHTSRVVYRLDLEEGSILSYYSFTERSWLSIDPTENLLSQLLAIELSKVPEKELRKRGPRPTDGPDRRPTWQPPLIIDGERQSDATFTSWRGHWPKDGSELSGREILVYLPDGEGSYLSGFPYWLEINGGAFRAHFRVVDSGKGMHSLLPSPSHL